MALQTSGPISLANIQTEFGGANPISIAEYYGVGSVPASGQISFNQFYGQTAFAAQWSGNSLATDSGLSQGVVTSGNLFRSEGSFDGGAAGGSWLAVNPDGTFQNGTSYYDTNGYLRGIAAGGAQGSLPNQLKVYEESYIYGTLVSDPITFSISNGFSSLDTTAEGYFYKLQVSSGLLSESPLIY